MSWDYDYDRPRRSRWADDYDPHLFRPEPSGAVTAVAVLSFVLGGLMLVLGMCAFFYGLLLRDVLMTGIFPFIPENMPNQIAFVIMVTLLLIVWAIGTIVSGIGVVLRQQWGRVLCLIMGGIGAILSIIWFVVGVNARDPLGGLHIMTLFICMLQAVVILGHTVLSYVILLNPSLTWEFRDNRPS